MRSLTPAQTSGRATSSPGIAIKGQLWRQGAENYDLVLGTPFLFQHKILVGFNPPRVVIGSASPLPMKGAEVTTLESRVATVVPDDLEETPLRAINHTIPLIDENKIYPWRPSRCPGEWEMASHQCW